MPEQVVIDFDVLGEKVGTAFEEKKPDQPFAKRLWRKEDWQKVLPILQPLAESRTPVKFIGHPSRWMICSVYYLLRNNELTAHLFHSEKDISAAPFTVGTPAEGQMLAFHTQAVERGIYLHAFAPEGCTPFDVFALDTVIAPALPRTTFLYIECDFPLLINGILTRTYADAAERFYTLQDGSWYCAVSPDSNEVGDIVPAPF